MRPVRYDDELIKTYTDQGLWDDRTWGEIYDRNAVELPDKLAFADGNRRFTWSELKGKYDNLALALLGMDFRREDRVIIQLPNSTENVISHLACEKAGLIRVFAAMNIGEAELDQFMAATGARAAVIVRQVGKTDYLQIWRNLKGKYPYLKLFLAGTDVPDDCISLEQLMVQTQEGNIEDLQKNSIGSNEVSLVMATTGTTGLPKLVEYTANNGKAHGQNYVQKWKITADDYCFVTAFLWSGPSMAGIYAAPQVGAACLLMENFEPLKALELVEKEKPTYISGFPIHLISMARHPEFKKFKIRSLRCLAHGGAPFPRGVAGEVEEKFGAKLLTYYGAMDSAATLAVEYDSPQEVRFVAVGKTPPGSEVRLLDDEKREVPFGEIGEVHVRGPMCCGGYYRDAAKTKEAWGALGLDGWFNMEDLGRFLEDGSLMLAGRKKEMILRGGQNIFPAEIEGFLNGFEKILNVAVVSMPDPDLGEKACAYIVPTAGERLTLEEVTEFLMGKKLARYKLPERIEVLDSMPMIGDKVNKRVLQEDIQQKLRVEGKLS